MIQCFLRTVRKKKDDLFLLQIFLAVLYTTVRYQCDPSILDHHEESYFGENAEREIFRRKKEQSYESWSEAEELDKVKTLLRLYNHLPNKFKGYFLFLGESFKLFSKQKILKRRFIVLLECKMHTMIT